MTSSSAAEHLARRFAPQRVDALQLHAAKARQAAQPDAVEGADTVHARIVSRMPECSVSSGARR